MPEGMTDNFKCGVSRIDVTPPVGRSLAGMGRCHFAKEIHDWLNAALEKENETVYFSDYNHGLIQKIPLNPDKELDSLLVRAMANEVIIGVLGISICEAL